MSNVDRAFGFEVCGPLLRARLYAVQTAPVINVMHGDIVVSGAEVISTKFGYKNIIADAAVPDDTADILGVVIAVMDENMDPVAYIAATETGDTTVAGYIMVADHPDQEFLVQEDGDTTPIAAANAGQNCDMQSATICAGNTGTGLSGQELDSTTVGTGADVQIKLIEPHPEDDVGSAYCRWKVQINEHHYGDTIAGA